MSKRTNLYICLCRFNKFFWLEYYKDLFYSIVTVFGSQWGVKGAVVMKFQLLYI